MISVATADREGYGWSPGIQRKVLACCLRDPLAWRAGGNRVYDARWVTHPPLKVIAEVLYKACSDGGGPPSSEMLEQLVLERMPYLRPAMADAVRAELAKVLAADLSDGPLIRMKAAEWARVQAVAQAVMHGAALVDSGNLENGKGTQLVQMLLDALAVGGRETSGVIRMIGDPETVAALLTAKPRRVATGLDALDDALHGGVTAGLHVIAGDSKLGKAVATETPVLTPTGWKRMGDIHVGDTVISQSGPTRVLGVYPQGDKELFRITFSDGRSTLCCDEHLWLVYELRQRKSRVMTTAYLRKRLAFKCNRRRFYIPNFSGQYGEDRDLPVDPWLLGALIGNGHIVGGKRSLGFSTSDAATLRRVQRLIAPELRICSSISRPASYRLVSIYGHRQRHGTSALRCALKFLGLLGCHAEHKFIPDVYKHASYATRLELLRGLMDTDGWAEKTGVVRYSSSSKQLALDVQDLVRSLGGTCYLAEKKAPHYVYKGEQRTGLPHYECRISYADPKQLFHLKRKRDRCFPPQRKRPLSILSIEPAGVMPAQCIRVADPSGLYVIQDYIVTHNTSFLAQVVRGATLQGLTVFWASAEMAEVSMATRFLAGLSGRTQAEVHADVRGALRSIHPYALAGGELLLEYAPSFTPAWFASRVRQLEAEGHTIDLAVADYIDIMGHDGDFQDERFRQKEIAHDLRNFAVESGIPVWSAKAVGRQAINKAVVTKKDLSEAIALAYVLDNLFALCSTEQERRKGNILRVNGQDWATPIVRLFYATGRLDLDEWTIAGYQRDNDRQRWREVPAYCEWFKENIAKKQQDGHEE